MSLVNKPTRVTRTNEDHFPIFLTTDPITSSEIKNIKNKRTLLFQRTINTATKKIKENMDILARKT